MFIGATAVCMIAAACGPEPTPLPVVPPTAISLPQNETSPVPIVPDNVVQYIVDPITEEIVASAFAGSLETPFVQVVPIPRLTGDTSEIILSSQPFENGQLLPTPFLFGIAIDPVNLPIESLEFLQGLTEYLRLLAAEQRDDIQLAEAQRNIREMLANAGYPDGVQINLEYAIPSLVQGLAVAGIDAAEDATRSAQLKVVFGDNQRESAATEYGETNVIYGFTLPVYYAASPDLQFTIGINGLPALANDP